MSKITKQHVRHSLERFQSELSEKQRLVILQSITSQTALDKLIHSLKTKLYRELVEQIRYTLSRLARASGANIELWGWMFASLDCSDALPLSPRARALSKMTTVPLQDAALAAIWYYDLGHVKELQLQPRAAWENYRLDASKITTGRSARECISFLQPRQMYFNELWIALCQQVIADKNRSGTAPRLYGRRSPAYGTVQQWVFAGSAEEWMALLQHVLIYPAGGKEENSLRKLLA